MGKTHSTAHTHISLLFTQSGTGLSLLLGARAATRAELSPLGALLTYRAEKGSATADKDFHLLSSQIYLRARTLCLRMKK